MGSSALILFCWEVGRGRGIVMGVLSFLLDFGLLGEWEWKRWMALADLAGGVGDGGSSLHCWGVFLGSSGFFCCFELLGCGWLRSLWYEYCLGLHGYCCCREWGRGTNCGTEMTGLRMSETFGPLLEASIFLSSFFLLLRETGRKRVFDIYYLSYVWAILRSRVLRLFSSLFFSAPCNLRRYQSSLIRGFVLVLSLSGCS